MSTSDKPPDSGAPAAAVSRHEPPPPSLTREEHIARHRELHAAMDELFADYIVHHRKQHGFLDMKLGDFLHWSYLQTVEPDEYKPQ